ncbi:methyltransferase domain-containing protein [Aquisalimonas lutea]|uniref:methyltransferase domain-containing protein n=1 Tax=Aquisalimonas lutea TaxID=1327750 RepID=UPI0025B5A37B|nr:methyltransferase domain-containing protein [Aquisalimonas lutea]MDN3519129.1 methyltransferase domain-containing protein [Aquisalimonas lutea]
MSATQGKDGYFLAGDDEPERLRIQAQVWEPDAEAMLERIGVMPGWSCADIGCGGVGVLGPLSHYVGTSGRVLGLDADRALLDTAAAYTRAEGLHNVELQQGDVREPNLPRCSFDLVHARFLLPHVESPAAVLDNMISLAKPGGTVASQENDHSSWSFYPHCPEWTELLDLLERTFALRGDINIGRRTFHMLKEAGLQDVRIRASVHALQNGHPYMRMPVIGARAMRERMIAAGLVTDREFDTLVQAVEQAIQNPDQVQITFTLVQAWGIRPAA